MSVLVRSNTYQASNRLFVKGAAEMVAARCNRIQLENGRVVSITSSMREEINNKIREMQSEPLRCLALAFKEAKELPGKLASVSTVEAATALPELQDDSKFIEIESNMVLAAITGIKDPARPEAGDAIVKCTNAGIRVIMMTGDSKDTAVAIARDVNIFGPYENTHIATSAFTGKEFFELPIDIQLSILSAGNKVFCRTEPKDKQKLISMLDDLGEVCAMTGDGVNDAPALQQADIGIAMGITGTEVSKNAADMILTDDNFATIVNAVEEGRNIYNNMQSFICFLLSCNIGEIVTIFISTALGIPEALTPLHLLWVNLVTDGPPATALGFNPPDLAAMTKPPRPKDEEIMSKSLLLRYIITGLYVGFATISSFIWWYRDKHVSLHHLMNWGSCTDWHSFTHSAEIPRLPDEPCNIFVGKHKSSAQSVALTTLVTMEMLKALSAVSLNQSLFSVAPWQNKYLLVGVTVPFLLHFAVLNVPWLSQIFGLTALNKQEWQIVVKFALPILILEEILKFFSRRQSEDKEELREEGQRAHIVSE
jgi:P-type Ca2+ transporter type 2C